MKIFTQISSIIVALLFICTINLKSIITINYFINQSEIIELFCVNKEKPALKCDGKCHLAKELVKVDDQEDFPLSQKNAEESSELIYEYAFEQIDFANNAFHYSKYWLILSEETLDMSYSILAPPPRT